MNEGVAVPSVDSKRSQSETLLADVFKLMDYPAKLEFKVVDNNVHFVFLGPCFWKQTKKKKTRKRS